MKGSIVEDIEEKRRIPVKVLWTLGAGAAALLLLWFSGVLDRDSSEPQVTSRGDGTLTNEDVSALRPEIHALRPTIVKLNPLIEKDPNRSSEPDEE